jgi:hypothetical protein
VNAFVTLKVNVRVDWKVVNAILTNDWQTYAVIPREVTLPAPAARFAVLVLEKDNYVSMPPPWEILSVEADAECREG